MRILILSDTHGNYPLALKAVEEYDMYDQVVHLGDEVEDALMLEQITGRHIVKVAGNCDYMTSQPRELCIVLGSTRVLITHGDKYQVKSGLARLHRKALQERAHVVLYGHSHRASIDTVGGILFVNPGCAINSAGIEPTCAILALERGEPRAEIVSLKKYLKPVI